MELASCTCVNGPYFYGEWLVCAIYTPSLPFYILSLWLSPTERKQKDLEENHHQVELLKEKADQLEKTWQERKHHNVAEWKEKQHKQQEHWQTHVESHKITRRKEAEKHKTDLLLHSHAPICTSIRGKYSSHQFPSGNVSASTSSTRSTSRRSKSATQPEKPNVRFMPTHTVHILDETLEEEAENEVDLDGSVSRGNTGTSTTAAATSQSVEEVIDLSKCDSESLPPSCKEKEEEDEMGSVDAFTATAESSDVGGAMQESASINTLASDIAQSAIEGAIERVATPTSASAKLHSVNGEKRDEQSAVLGQGSDISIAMIASDVVEKAIQDAVERVATPTITPTPQ